MNPSKRHYIAAAVLLAAAVGAGIAWRAATRPAANGLIQANGRIETDTINVASKLAGRIVTLAAREGDSVKAGALLVQIDDRALRARLAEAQAAQATVAARVAAARLSLAVLRRQVPVLIASAQAALESAAAAERRAVAAETQEQRDAERARTLVAQGFVHEQTAEKSDLAWRAAQDQQRAARAARVQAEQALAEARLGPDRIRASEAELLGLEAAEREAGARVGEAQVGVEDLRVTSPADGIITARFANLGEVVNAGMPLLELVDLDRLYLKVYVPEKQIGLVHLGLPARVHADAFPSEPFEATVRYIASRAEFTPKEVQTPDERTKLVYEVRLYLEHNPGHRLTPGLPADAVIRWKEDVAWALPRW
jgi:HlyD family secretion protein